MGNCLNIQTKKYGEVTLRLCCSEPGGPVMEITANTEDPEFAGISALSKKQARKLALALLGWSES